MPDHRITPELLGAVTCARAAPAARRCSLTARLTARLRAHRYDRMLAVGVSADPGSPLAAHRTRLTSTTERQAVASALLRAVREARDPDVHSWRIPVHIVNVIAAADLIDQVRLRLQSPRPVGVLGMARLRLVLSDGAGPLYRFGRGDLTGRLGAALAEL